jgi:hypothetical protein
MTKPYPSPPSDAPSDTVWFGGPIPWFSISLSITADDLDPDKVTRLLGIEPDEARRRGVPAKNGRPARFGAWSIRLRRDQTAEWDVGVAVGVLLDRVSASPEAWEQARVNANARVFLGLHLDSFNRGLALSTDLMRRLADFGLQLDIDIYAADADKIQE